MARILVVDNEAESRTALIDSLEAAGHSVDQATDCKKAVSSACVYVYDLVVLNIDLPKKSGVRALRSIRDECPELPIVVTTGGQSLDAVVQAIDSGAYDYMIRPLHAGIITLTTERALARRRSADLNSRLLREIRGRYDIEAICGLSPASRNAYQMAREISSTDSPVLIVGESGIGREFCARGIHYNSPRAGGPFAKLNCAGMSDETICIELFGRERGGPGSSSAKHTGALEQADGGTVFLNEMGDIGPDLQEKLLRVLMHGEFERVGGSTTLRLNVRVIVSTSKDISSMTGSSELYDYLNVFTISLPPLRERVEDIPGLVKHFIAKYAGETGKNVAGMADAAAQQVIACDWKGNIRDLENCIERSVMLCDGDTIQPAHISLNGANGAGKRKQNFMRPLRDVERDHIKKVLAQCNWNKSAAALVLQIDRKTLRCKIREFGLADPGDMAASQPTS